ncbi:hypothetical protein SAPIO_CDS10369 [Scedosporium apiospermum]|uniref:DUF7791 domain-containing protein n=1 Tax=Pseudallescheria apiosperma TaxID=563466 RepID=A0A084FV92_PSEDA|nr:uncharacterized protein SAPIO_CDS10369 [Scedosporium apiospermum]KEZ39004.1 hypothetical protein SAPIO_CDS10369 [Scedosporium apiospermum]
MDPITSLGVASTAIQIIDFGVRFLSQVKELSDSAKLDLDEFAPLRQEATQLRSLNGILIDAVRRRKELHESNPMKRRHSASARSRMTLRELVNLSDQSTYSPKLAWDEALTLQKWVTQQRSYMENLHARLLTAVQSSQHLVLRSLSQQKWDGLRSWDDSPVVQTLKTSLLENLEFDEIAERQRRIPCAFDDTFEWIFSDHNSAATDGERTWSSLSKWLVEGDGASIYWITGKAESGKSTLMKKLFQDPRTERLLAECGGSVPVVTANFFFWCSDGLDEFSGEPSKLIALLRRLAAYQNIKICVSSRPWMEFEDAFKKQPNLMMQHQTARDIAHYSRESLSKNPAFCEIATYDPKYAENLIQNIVTKASGVFLWVVLVVSSLLEGLAQGDRPSELQMRLEKLPDELDELFTKMLHGMEGQNFRDASHIFRIVHAAAEKPSLLVLSIADDDNVGWALERDVVPLETGELWYNAVRMRRRLGRGSVVPTEIFDSGPQRHISASDITVDDGYLLAAPKVDYLHRTVKDFLLSSPVWDRIEAACDSGFDPHKGLFRAYLVHLKTLPEDKLHPVLFGKLISLCISESRHFAQTDTSLYVRYLDELDQAAVSLTSKKGNMGVTYINRFWKEGNHHWASTLSRSKPTDNFLTVAACCDLVEYLSAKFADNPPSRELASALRADVLTRSDMRSILEGRRRRGQNPCQQVLELLSQYDTTKGKGPLGSNPFHNSRESRGPQPPEFDPTDRMRRASIKGVYKGRRGRGQVSLAMSVRGLMPFSQTASTIPRPAIAEMFYYSEDPKTDLM